MSRLPKKYSVANAAIAATLSGALVLTGVPTPALAEVADEVPATDQVESAGVEPASEASQGEKDVASAAVDSSDAGATDAAEVSGDSLADGTAGSAAGDVSASEAQANATSASDGMVFSTLGVDDGDDDPEPIAVYTVLISLSKGGSAVTQYSDADTIWANSKVKGSSDYIDPNKLTYQWQVSPVKSATSPEWEDVAGATEQSFSLAGYAGKYVRVVVRDKAGTSECKSTARNLVKVAGALEVTSVSLSATGTVAPGTTVSATAMAGSGDVTADPSVTWSWYCGQYAYNAAKIEGANGSSLAITDDMDGKIVFARATTGAGYEDSLSLTVKAPGKVSLHHVTVEGASAGEAVSAGATLSAVAYKSSYTKVAAGDSVKYQWQCATSDSSYATWQDIPGATSATLTVADSMGGVSMLGMYLRVKAVSDGEVVSTSQKSYYGSTSVKPVGPVKLAGAYDLTSVQLASSAAGMQAGATITATPQVKSKYGYGEDNVPADAKLTLTWHVAEDASGANARVLAAADGVREKNTLVLGDALVGKYVWVTASSLGTPAESAKTLIRGARDFDLLRAEMLLNGSTATSYNAKTPLTGDAVSVRVIAKRLGATYSGTTGTGDDVTSKVGKGVAVAWQMADSADAADADWVDAGMGDAAEASIPAAAKGKYLRAVVTSGEGAAATSVVAALPGKVANASSLEGAVTRLNNIDWVPTLDFNYDENLNAVYEAELAALGYDDVKVTTKAVTFSSTDANATVGIATDAQNNGAITYYSGDPDLVNRYSVLRLQTVDSLELVFEKGGETVTYSPTKSFRVPWNNDKAEEYLEREAAKIELGLAAGDTADSVTKNLSLPYKAGGTTWANVEWKSSDESAVRVSGYGYSDYTGRVSRGSLDSGVRLTAVVKGLSNYNLPDGVSVTKSFDLVVKGDAASVEDQKAALGSSLANYAYKNVRLDAGEAVSADGAGVTDDLLLPTPRVLGVDGKYYPVTYTSDSDAVQISGYRAKVARGLPGTEPQVVNITCTVKSAANSEVSVQKTLQFVIDPMSAEDIESAIRLMDAAVAGYGQALLGGQDGAGVTQNLRPFQKAYMDEKGNLAWSYDRTTSDAHRGIVLQDLPSYNPMGSYSQARTFASGDTKLVLNETLQLAWNSQNETMLSQWQPQPTYNKKVTVSSILTDERFAEMAARYKDDASWGQKLASLINRQVSATFTILGTTGEDEPAKPGDSARPSGGDQGGKDGSKTNAGTKAPATSRRGVVVRGVASLVRVDAPAAGAADEKGDGEPLGLLSSYESDAEDGAQSVAAATEASVETAVVRDSAVEQERANLPVWPIVGMASGALALLLAAFKRRRKDEE